MQATVHRKSLLIATIIGTLGTAPSCPAEQILWSTGEPQAITLENSARVIWLYVSGRSDENSPQRFAAAAFRLDRAASITGINALYTDRDSQNGTRTNPNDVSYIIWERTALTAPTTIAAEGSFGRYSDGSRFTGADVSGENDYVHEHSVDLLLSAGDYYLTLYSRDTTINWVTGGRQPDSSLEQDFMWRSRRIPTPGFEPYYWDGTTELLADSKDAYNPVFSIVGEYVPEPTGSVVVMVLAAPLFVAVRRHVGARRQF